MKQGKNLLVGRASTASIFLTILLVACGAGDDQKTPEAGAAPPPPEVDVVTATPGSVVLTQDLPGRLQAFRTAEVRARVEGIVEKRMFTEGSEIKEGDALYQIYSRNYQTAFDAARSEVTNAEQTLTRYKSLLESKAVSQQGYDLVEAKVKQADAVFSKAQEDLKNTRVPAPISGRIGRSKVSEGALVGRGEATHLATIEQIDPLYANFNQSGADLLRLKQAIKAGKLKRSGSTRVELVLEDGSIYAQPGELLFADLAVDPGTGSVSLRAVFPNPQRELLPGMFVSVRLPQADVDNTIRLPQRAIQMTPQGQIVMVVDAEGKVSPRPVKTGSMSGSDFIIAEGLQGGEQVIVNGLQKARPGSIVKAVPLSEDRGQKTEDSTTPPKANSNL